MHDFHIFFKLNTFFDSVSEGDKGKDPVECDDHDDDQEGEYKCLLYPVNFINIGRRNTNACPNL